MPYFSYQNIVEGQEVVGYHLNCVLFLRTAKINTEGWLTQLRGSIMHVYPCDRLISPW